jgi:hypothetical protein
MEKHTSKTTWEIARWQRKKAADQKSQPLKDKEYLPKSYGKLRLIASIQETKEDICFLNSLSELSREMIFSKKPVKNTQIEEEIYKNLI